MNCMIVSRTRISIYMKPLLFFLFTSFHSLAQPSADSISKLSDSVFHQFNTTKGPGCAVAFIKEGKVVFKKGYGLASLEYGIPITTSTVFDIASLSKQFTGLAISTLLQEKKIFLDDNIRKYLPQVPDFGQPITVSHLVHHTSGLRDWPEALAFAGYKWEDVMSFNDILRMVQNQKELDFAPGTAYSYSNTGYNLLAAIVEKVTGKSFRTWTVQNIFTPLNMPSALFLDTHTEVIKNMAFSYRSSPGGFLKAPSQLTAYGSSSMFTSLDDFIKWAIHLQQAWTKEDPVYNRMREGSILANGDKVLYGFGLVEGKYRGLTTLSHTGSWAGYRSLSLYFPDQNAAIILFGNAAELNIELGYRLADAVLANYFKTVEIKLSGITAANETLTLSPSVLNQYSGTYKLRPGWLLTITLEGKQLMAQATNEEKYPMLAKTDSSFWVPAYGAAIIFNRNKEGKTEQLTYKTFQAKKIVPFTPDTKKLKEYNGTYFSEELQTSYTISRLHEKLFINHRRRGDFPLQVSEEDEFALPLGSLRFIRGKKNKVTGFKLSGSRVKNIHFERK